MKSYLQATLVLLCIGTSLACNGYEVVVGDPKSCGGNKELLNITSLTGVLSEDCKVQGSITFETSGFEKANVSLSSLLFKLVGLKNGVSVELCNFLMKTKGPIRQILANAPELPQDCPILAGAYSSGDIGPIDISKLKKYLTAAAMLRTQNVKIQLKTESSNVCISISGKVQKRQKRPNKS